MLEPLALLAAIAIIAYVLWVGQRALLARNDRVELELAVAQVKLELARDHPQPRPPVSATDLNSLSPTEAIEVSEMSYLTFAIKQKPKNTPVDKGELFNMMVSVFGHIAGGREAANKLVDRIIGKILSAGEKITVDTVNAAIKKLLDDTIKAPNTETDIHVVQICIPTFQSAPLGHSPPNLIPVSSAKHPRPKRTPTRPSSCVSHTLASTH